MEINSKLVKALVLGLFVPACATPTALAPLPALAAPAPSPPGDLAAEQRLAWWKKRVDRLPPADMAEARICIGNILLELEQSSSARQYFYAALPKNISAKETGQAKLGIAKSWLLEGKTSTALRHLEEALPYLSGPPLEEGAYLLAWASGGDVAGYVEASLIKRLGPFMQGTSPVPATPPTGGRMQVAVARASWTSLQIRGNHVPMGKPFRITIHHSAEPLRSVQLSDSLREVRGIQRAHRQKGWAGIGYHFLIDRKGRVIEGRPLSIQGAHAGDNERNRGNIGICLLGNFQSQSDRGLSYQAAQSPSSAQLRGLTELLGKLRAEFTINASDVKSHLELKGTLCPGPELDAWTKTYRSRN